MTKILFALALAGSAFASAPVLADVNYYGTPSRVTASQEQNNADAGPVSARARTTTETAANFGNAPTVYGYATTTENMGISRAPTEAAAPYLGTSWRYQDNADAGMR